MLEGKYVIQPELPAVLGNEGVGIVESVGPDVTLFKVGDRVIRPFSKDAWIGWWTEGFLVQEADLMGVPDWMATHQASMVTVNPITAYHLLTRFVDLKPGDVVVQNAGNSSVAGWVHRIGLAMGYTVVSLVRTQAQVDSLTKKGFKAYLDEENCHEKLSSFESHLALNAVGGLSSKELMKSVANDGVVVTYGAMSKQPIMISNSALIYKNIWVTGFNRNKWIDEALREEVESAYAKLFSLLEKMTMDVPIENTYHFDQASIAIDHAMREHRNGKVIFDLA